MKKQNSNYSWATIELKIPKLIFLSYEIYDFSPYFVKLTTI